MWGAPRDYDEAACYSITFESERGFSRSVNVADAVNIVNAVNALRLEAVTTFTIFTTFTLFTAFHAASHISSLIGVGL